MKKRVKDINRKRIINYANFCYIICVWWMYLQEQNKTEESFQNKVQGINEKSIII